MPFRVVAVLAFLCLSTPALASCPGDCNDDAVVTVDELLHAVAISLSDGSITDCRALDIDGSATVTIDELISAVRSALHGCPPVTATTVIDATPSPTPPPTQDTILAAIEPAFRQLCGETSEYGYLQPTTTGYDGFCSPVGSDYTSVIIDRYDDAVAARDAFAEAGRVGPPYDFAGFPAVLWQRGLDGPHDVGTRTMVWQLGCWVVSVHSDYARTGLPEALSPQLVSQTILDVAGTSLLNRCPIDAASPTPTRGSGPDLVVVDIDAYADNDSCQPYAVLTVCIANAGREAAAACTVTISPGSDRFELPALEGGAASCSIRPYPDGRRVGTDVTVAVDAEGDVNEVDETNNTLSKRVMYPWVEATCIPTRIPTPHSR